MNNFVKYGSGYDYVNGTGSEINVGAVVAIGDLIGVAETNIAIGATGTVITSGVVNIAKKTGEAWTQGQKLYWDPSNSWLTTTAGSLIQVGWAFTAQASGDVLGQIKLKAS